MPFIAYLSQTLNKNNKPTTTHTHHACLQSSSLSALRRPTHTNTRTQGRNPRQSAYKVCAFLLNKMLASTIQLSTSNQVTLAGQPAQPHPALIPSTFRRRGREKVTCVIPQGPTVCQDQTGSRRLQVPRPHPEGMDSTEKHTRQPAGVSSTIPLASSTITTQPNAV